MWCQSSFFIFPASVIIFLCRKRLSVKISYRGTEPQQKQGPPGTKKVSLMQLSFPSFYSGLSEQFADSAANKPRPCSTIKELKSFLKDSAHLCTVGSAGGRDTPRMLTYIVREPSLDYLKAPPHYYSFLRTSSRGCAVCGFLWVIKLGFSSPHSEVSPVRLPRFACMRAWIRILCVPSNSRTSVCLHR